MDDIDKAIARAVFGSLVKGFPEGDAFTHQQRSRALPPKDEGWIDLVAFVNEVAADQRVRVEA